MDVREATHPSQIPSLTTDELRDRFLAAGLFAAGEVRLLYAKEERLVLGGARPGRGGELYLAAPPELRAEDFCERREVGIVNLGGSGAVSVADRDYAMGRLDCLYVGRGAGPIRFHDDGDGDPAVFYLASAGAHATYGTTLVTREQATSVHLGSAEECNERTIYKYIFDEGIASAQLVLGVTVLAPGSVWNTMPCHIHGRRTEVYLYFGLAAGQRIVHLMGAPDQTRSLIVSDLEAVISPSWSIHCGAGTGSYGFVWAMAGENQDYGDMDQLAIADLR